MACMMSPIISLSVAGLAAKDIGQAVGLSNAVRQLGGAVGIAIINLFLTQKNAQVRASMITYVNDYSNQAVERLNTLKQGYLARGYSMDEAQYLANRAMEGMLFKQQALVSYNQGFFMVALVVLILFPVVYLVRKAKKETAVVSDAH